MTSQPRARFAFLWIALIPVGLTAVALWLSRQFRDEVAWITHTYEVRSSIRESVLLVWNADRDLRNYLLSGKESYLRASETGAAQAPIELERLRKLTADNRPQQRNVERFKPLVDTKLADLRRTLNLSRRKGVDAALSPIEVDGSQRLMEQIRDASRELMEEEERALLARSRIEARTSRQVEVIFASAIGVTLALLFWVGRLAKNYAASRDQAEGALQQKVSEIEILNRDLECRVEERTAELRQSNADLARSNHESRLLASIVESSDDAMLVRSLEGAIETWNSGAERLYGYKPEEIIGHNIRELVPQDRSHEEYDIVQRLRNGERVDHFETVRVRKDGSPVEVSLTLSPIRDKAGQIAGAAHVARDITDQKRGAEVLRQAQKLESLGVIAGGIAHDFNNLLVGILGNASLALEQLRSDSSVRVPIQDVVAAGERAAELTRKMLAYSGRGQFVLDHIDLSTDVREIVPLIQAAIPRTVEIRLEQEEDLPTIEADATQVQQLFMNLVINGAEAIPAGRHGIVTIGTRRQHVDEQYLRVLATADRNELNPGCYVLLEVRDTGCGMDEPTKARIFDPFFTTKFTGRGLGLAAVIGIVRGHAGSIEVSSVLGQGTVFRVLFPALTHSRDRRLRQPQEAQDLSGQGAILVIDDEQIVRSLAKQALEHYGYSVLVAEDGQRGLEVFRRDAGRIKCVLLDLTMPVMSGEETFPRLQAVRADVPIILSSGFSEVEAASRFAGKGLAGFLQKPYRAAALSGKIKEITSRGNASA